MDKPRTFKIEWNKKPEEKNFWKKHETQIFNGIQRGIEYIAAGSVIA